MHVALLDETKGNQHHSVNGLVDIAGSLIEDLNAKHHRLPEASGAALKFLTKKHNLKQSELSETVIRRQMTAETEQCSQPPGELLGTS